MKQPFVPISFRRLELKNRIVMPPMCMYSAAQDGFATPWHAHHYGKYAIGQIGLIVQEATAISPEGRISDNDLGIWSDEHISPLRRITDAVHEFGGAIGIQLNHAGRKAQTVATPLIGPSALAFNAKTETPLAMNDADILRVIDAFASTARRAVEAGYDLIEIHGAHGYLVSSFLSPLSNLRTDRWGTSDTLFLREVICAVRAAIPADFPLALRLSATDHVEGGMDDERLIRIVEQAKELGVDVIHVSTGGVVEAPIKLYPGYQVSYATMVRERCGIPVIAGGLLDTLDHVTDILENKRADLVYLGRALLRNPHWALDAMARYGLRDELIPKPYRRGW